MTGAIDIAVDTGGTFTDAVVRQSGKTEQRIKVLSSSAIRARVARSASQSELAVEVPALERLASEGDPALCARLVLGWRLRGQRSAGVVVDAEWRSGLLHLRCNRATVEFRGEASLEALPVGALLDLASPWPAPILAARLLLCCPGDEPLPPLAMRLGTTRGTNAVLEGRFDPVLLVTNAGLGDALQIGDQRRSQLFAPAPRTQPAIHRRTLEVTLRQDASGREIEPLDEAVLRADARDALANHGVTHAAVVLLHAWRNPGPEERLATILRDIGFTRVVASHECSGIEGYLPRGMATVVDAALSSAVGDFLDAVRAGLSRGSMLEVATSSAALRPALRFPPRECLLSGPAGGAASLHFMRERVMRRDEGDARVPPVAALLGFDMGGTSTDAIRVTDHLPRRDQTPIAGRTMALPSLVIESVAAGGGSRCRLDHGVWRVGPESAGSVPGPACYGRGGPLTVTDIDLLLGRCDPRHFAVPLDPRAAERALRSEVLSDAVSGAVSNDDLTEHLARFNAITDDAMASALRLISVREGFEPSTHALIAYGGAGGQHACTVAELLGIRRVIHPAAAGLLSASGMFSLRRDRLRSESVESALSIEALSGGVARARVALREEAPPHSASELMVERVDAALAWGNRSAVLEIEIDTDLQGRPTGRIEAIETAARQRYRAIFGTDPPSGPGASMRISFVRVTARWSEPSSADEHADASPTAVGVPAIACSPHRMWSRGEWHDAITIHRASLVPGAPIEGPAIIADAHSTLVIDVGWRGTLVDRGDIEVIRVNSADAGSLSVHGVEEIRASALASAAAEMGEQLRRTAVSVNVRDRLDYSCGILDHQGRLATNAPHVPVHLGALGACVVEISKRHTWAPGEVLVTNHPAFGGSHLPDVTVVMPFFTKVDGRDSIASQQGDANRGSESRSAIVGNDAALAGFLAARAHHAEIGGIRPGSMTPTARQLTDEGVVIPPTRIAADGVVNLAPLRTILAGGRHPSRAIDDNLADVAAAVAALRRGADALDALVQRDGLAALLNAFDALRARSRACVERAIEVLSERARGAGRRGLHSRQTLDDGWPIEVRVEPRGRRVRIDFTGSGPVHPGSFNAPLAVTRSAVMYAIRVLVESIEPTDDRVLPLNDGLLEPVDLIVPEGFLNPPAESGVPVAAGNTETSQRVVDALLLALGVAACSQGTMNNLVMGGAGWSFYETIAGGLGATARADGASGVHAHMTNTRITDPETLEAHFPLRLRRFAYRRLPGAAAIARDGATPRSSGEPAPPSHATESREAFGAGISLTESRPPHGAGSLHHGARRGGSGLIREFEFLTPALVALTSQRRASGPEGVDGGAPGEPGGQRLRRSDGHSTPLPGLFDIEVQAGDRVTIETPGGGGWGHSNEPSARD
ncbi:MAG: hydantoinase B/oxoprolinase family protein [Phycisphaeraceae bacterium]|nr:hydantoinase B/oxoprolinase family protein [Phycisphaeraceae bacterium]